MKYNTLDNILNAACPTVIIPKYGEFVPLEVTGQRYLCACDGFWIEIRRPWLHLIWPVALQGDFSMPYGAIEKKIDLTFGKIPAHLVDLFLDDAQAAFPNEFGAWLVWDDNTKELVYRPLKAIKATGGYLKVERPSLDEHESLAVDLHSHGRHKAFFSAEDNRDDKLEVKVSGVYGSLDRDISKVFRLCTGGRFINLNRRNESKLNA